MSSADGWGSFAQGFAGSYVDSKKRTEAKKHDMVKIGASAFLKNEAIYNAGKREDEKLITQAKAFAKSESTIPDNAYLFVYEKLKGGVSTNQILRDVRAEGSAFNLIEEPEQVTGMEVLGGSPLNTLETPTDNDITDIDTQTKDILGGQNKETDTQNVSTLSTAQEQKEVTPTKEDKNNPFSKHRTDIAEMVGYGDKLGEFDNVLAGYKPEERKPLYKFTYGTAAESVKTLDQMLAKTVTNSKEYKTATDSGDTETQQKLILEAISKKKEKGNLNFGSGGAGAAMQVWVQTEEGKKALIQGDAVAIAKQFNTFSKVVDNGKGNTTEFDFNDPTNSLMEVWAKTEEGIKAIEEGDGKAIAQALNNAQNQTLLINDQVNKSIGFDPSEVTDLNQIPGLRETHKDDPTVLKQLKDIAEGLTSLKNKTSGGKVKPYTVMSATMVNGQPLILGTGYLHPDGSLEIGGEVVPRKLQSSMILLSSDHQVNTSKWSASEYNKRLVNLDSAVNFSETAAYYVAGLNETPSARTYVSRLVAKGVEIVNEFSTAKELASYVDTDSDGNEVTKIDKDKFISAIESGAGALGQYSQEVRSIMAQEAQMVFAYGKADGNSGAALSNKDYDNYHGSIFNSNDPEVVKENIRRLIGTKFNAAERAAKRIGKLSGMDLAIQGTGGAWWKDPRKYAFNGMQPGVMQFITDSTDQVNAKVNTLVRKNTPKPQSPAEAVKAYENGETITLTEELIKMYPVLAGKQVGTTMTKSKGNQ